MPYLGSPWDDDEDQWLPPNDPRRVPLYDPLMARASMGAPPPIATPPFLSPPPIGPVSPSLPPPTALSRLQDLEQRRPVFQPSAKRQFAGGLAAALAGGAAGYLNASGKPGLRVDPNAGARIGSGIIEGPYNREMREFEDKRTPLEMQAKLESIQQAENLKAQDSERRGQLYERQGAAADATKARAERITPPKPAAETPAEAIRRRKREAVDDLGMTPGTPEYNRYVAEGKSTYEPPKVTRPTVTDLNKERETEADRLGLKGDDRTAYIVNGKVPPKKAPKAAGVTAGKTAVRNSEESAALKLLKDSGGNHDAAIAASSTPAQRKWLLADKRGVQLSSGGKGEGDTASRIKEALAQVNGGGKNAQSASEPPPEAKRQLKEGVETTFGNGQVWTLRNGKSVKIR